MVRTKIEDHMPLVHFIVRGFVPLGRQGRLEDAEEYSDGLFGLSRAWMAYDKSWDTAFSTFAYPCIYNEICKGLKKRQREKKDERVVGLSSRNLSLIPSRDVPNVDDKELAEQLLARYPVDRETDVTNKLILLDFIGGKKQTEIAKELGISKEAVRQRKNKALEMIKRICALIG